MNRSAKFKIAIVSLHFDHRMSYGRIASTTGLSRNTIAGMINRNRPANAQAPRGIGGYEISKCTMRGAQ